MIIERLGEATPLLDEMLNALHAEVVRDDRLVVMPDGIRTDAEGRVDVRGRPSPVELLVALRARVEDGWLVIPTHAIRWTHDGIEVNVRNHFARLHEGRWKAPLIRQTEGASP